MCGLFLSSDHNHDRHDHERHARHGSLRVCDLQSASIQIGIHPSGGSKRAEAVPSAQSSQSSIATPWPLVCSLYLLCVALERQRSVALLTSGEYWSALPNALDPDSWPSSLCLGVRETQDDGCSDARKSIARPVMTRMTRVACRLVFILSQYRVPHAAKSLPVFPWNNEHNAAYGILVMQAGLLYSALGTPVQASVYIHGSTRFRTSRHGVSPRVLDMAHVLDSLLLPGRS